MMKLAMAFLVGAAIVALSAAEMDVNGAFKVSKPGQQLPDKWIFNNGPNPVGSHKTVTKDGKTSVTITAEKSMYGIVYAQKFPVKPGERYALSVNATGSNVRANVGLQLSNSKSYLVGNYDKNVTLTGQTVNIKRVITIPETVKGQTPEQMSVLFLIWAPGEATFDTFKLEKLD